MAVSTVVPGQAVTPAATSAPKQPPKSDEGNPRMAAAKKDVAIISERAKDLAAVEAGKAASEESNDSMAAKAMEASKADAVQVEPKT